MRKKLLALCVVCLASVPLFSLGGIEGTMEYALDAPWRIEPIIDSAGRADYGAIPIQISIHDADVIPEDPARGVLPGRLEPTLGNFCSLTIDEHLSNGVRRKSVEFAALEEIETSRRWTSQSALAPEHHVCKPDEATDGCERLRNVTNTAEWHAVAWYTPVTKAKGSDVALTLTANVTSHPSIRCENAGQSERIRLRNDVTVHLAEDSLPRFDDRWLYGDVHYHSQGTDNEGESAYNYRGVVRAMGAMGLDFVLAAEHASNSKQIIDADVDLDTCGINPTQNYGALRDMSLNRFRFLNEQLHGASGANRTTALTGAGQRLPQNYLSHRVFPQIFLGGEIDAIPETATDDRYLPYGNGKTFDIDYLDDGREPIPNCKPTRDYTRFEQASNGWLVNDVQGLNDSDYGREHMVYLPRSGADVNAFVASDSGKYGGAGRRLAETHKGRPPLLPEIAAKGYAFLAHPLNDGKGGKGPDGPPWSDFMIRKAWRSRGVLGLQFWNEPTRLTTKMDKADAKEDGYDFGGSFVDKLAGLAESRRDGFDAGRFQLFPYFDMLNRAFESWSDGLEGRLHHGAYTWDTWLREGLNTRETKQLSWLPDGEPRRFFIAGGSDAHGDLNYRRDGYFLGTEKVTDVAIAKVRNLVFAGAPTLPRDENIPSGLTGKPAERHSHDQVVSALASGNFVTTDGPALRIVVDRNRNGEIDDSDTPMGGIVELHGEPTLPLIVEWQSTEEFGPVEKVSLYLGVRNDEAGAAGESRVYAPALHGPRSRTLDNYSVSNSYKHDGRTYALMQDDYWRDPTGLLTIPIPTPSIRGKYAVALPLAAFEAAFSPSAIPDHRSKPGDRFFVRAFARTTMQDRDGCQLGTTSDSDAAQLPTRKGACIRRYALTNPIWAITKAAPIGGCQPTTRGLDIDGDGLPDGCDPCPLTASVYCRIMSPSPAPSPGPIAR